MSVFLAVLIIGAIDYGRVDTIVSKGTWVDCPIEMRRTLCNNTTIDRIMVDNEGFHVLINRDKEDKNWDSSYAKKWLCWTDGLGRPWLVKLLSPWRSYYWQAKDWRGWSFPNEKAWETYYTNADGSSIKKRMEENYGINWPSLPNGMSGDGPINPEQPCPGPGPCPRPQPGPVGPDDCFPKIEPKVNVNVDPMVVAGVLGVVGFIVITMIGVTCVILIKRRIS